jgi:arginine decarboxylase
VLTLEQRARVEQMYFATCNRLREVLSPRSRAAREIIDELNDKLAEKYFCNFSLFQSLPDVWAIGQIFPIVPLHRLGEEPARRAVLNDITCDSDGRIDQYVDAAGIESSLPVHNVRSDDPYYLGMFLVGAYQEILGDIHNLFGDTNSVHVIVQEDGSHYIEEPISGDRVDDMLRAVGFDAEELYTIYELKTEASTLGFEAREECLKMLRAGLEGYTYFEDW